ncbi:hypothetical protein AVEN_87427-1 [Araneus ventricosus]|uniref:Histone-lysine N-methyltransferase SETMAR n=1 Tax=Araneus ventricosus TaxID=182803 RepID=A0A4Y2J9P9_ARAVE|nr:hypothetical protein AVEN_87427-1 [Araneus ventricosus]
MSLRKIVLWVRDESSPTSWIVTLHFTNIPENKKHRCSLPIQTKDRSHIFAAQLTPLSDHPPYSPDLAPSDFHLFLKLKEFLGGKRFGSDEELKNAATTCLNELAAEEYNMGILKFVGRYDKCLNGGSDYVEK